MALPGTNQEQINSILTLFTNGRFQKALDLIEKLLLDFPNEAILFNIQGACHAELGALDIAIKSYEHAISINQNYSKAWNNAGYALHKLGKSEDGLEYVEKALELDPTDPDALDSKREILRALGKTD